MIAWLLTPNGEHGLGRAFVEHMGDLLAEKGVPLLKNALRAGDPITVATEWPEQGCRYDIRLKVGTHHFILENKTKSIGGKTQRDAYEQRGYIVILLGLTPFSFEPKLRKDCHLVTYRHVESFLKSLLPFSDNDFGVLLRHYHQFLTRELHLLQDLI
jgi:hypothetical protein